MRRRRVGGGRRRAYVAYNFLNLCVGGAQLVRRWLTNSRTVRRWFVGGLQFPEPLRSWYVGGLQFPEPCVYLDDLHRLSTIGRGLATRMKHIADSRYLGDDHQNQIEGVSGLLSVMY